MKRRPRFGHNGHIGACPCEKCQDSRRVKREQTERRKPYAKVGVNIAWVIWIFFSIYVATHDTSIAPHKGHQQEIQNGR